MDLDQVSYVDYACGWNRYTMKLLGIWPEERKLNVASSYVILVLFLIILLFINVPQTVNLYYIWGDFDGIVENLSLVNISGTVTFFKASIFWFNGKSLKSLLSYMGKHRRQAETKEEVTRIMQIAKFSRTISIASAVFAEIAAASLLISRILFIHNIGRTHILPAYFPYDSLTTPNYQLTAVGQSVAIIYAANTYVAVDTFLAMLVLHVCGQLECLRHQLNDMCSEGSTMFRVRFARIIRRHDSLNRFVDTIENKFNVMLLIQMVGCTLQLCVQCFQTITTLNGDKDEFYFFQMTFCAIYILILLVQIYLYCYIGEKLVTESTEIAYAAYNCEWYNMLPKEIKCLMLIIRRARSPLRITAGKFCSFNHERFSDILKTTMGYISVLCTVGTSDAE